MQLSTPLIFSGFSLLLMSIFGYFSSPLCRVLGLMDIPNERKLHGRPTPLAGGLALCLVILPVSLLATLLSAPSMMQHSLLICIAAVAVMALIGLADDRHNLAAHGRLVLSLLVFLIVAFADPLFNVRVLDFHTPRLSFGVGSNWMGYLFTTVCGVGLVNAINMADGKNGLVIGLLIGWLAVLEHFAPLPLLPLILIAQSGLIVLFIFNLQGLVFLGDGGSYGFGCLISLLTIAVYNSPAGAHAPRLTADTIVLLFSVPVIDSFRLTFYRMSRGMSPMSADRDHLHHYLQNQFGWPTGLIVYLVAALLPAILWAAFI
jgi:UDP-GlcNAc:undecaprenyl-phosphate GlcNAc-1-phosphate transferase